MSGANVVDLPHRAAPAVPSETADLDERLRALDILGTPVWVFDVDRNRMLWANQAAVAFWQADDLAELRLRDMGRELSVLVHRRLHRYRFALRAGQHVEEVWTFFPRGTPRATISRFSGCPQADGNPALLVEVLQDAAVPGASQRLQEALTLAPVMITLYRTDGCLLEASTAARTALGGLISRRLDTRFTDLTEGRAVLARLRENIPQQGEFRMQTTQGTRWHQFDARLGEDPVTGQPMVVVTETDITSQRHTVTALHATQRALEKRVRESDPDPHRKGLRQAQTAGSNVRETPGGAGAAGRPGPDNDLRRALLEDELVLHYQPRIALSANRICGAEALVRWQHPTRGLLGPDAFIPIAEDCGLIHQLDDWVLRAAMRQSRLWQDQGLPALPLSVNLSAAGFRQPGLAERISAILKDSRLDPGCLELELTEGMLMHNAAEVVPILNALHERGVRLVVGRFGTGYSNLAYLRRFPVDGLKIDRSFIREIPFNSEDTVVCQAIIAMTQSLGLGVVAEGVERSEQLEWLRLQGCDEFQGFIHGRPRNPTQFGRQLQRGLDDALISLPGSYNP